MTAIAGITQKHKSELVDSMLNAMKHRGPAWQEVREDDGKTFGVIGFKTQSLARNNLKRGLVRDSIGKGHFAQAQVTDNEFELKRDPIGVAPLYYGRTSEGALCFASEVMGLLEVTHDVHELLPGYIYDGSQLKPYHRIAALPPLDKPTDDIARELRGRLETSVRRRIGDGNVGAWLSGGLDSSSMAALARRSVSRFHTFAAGLPGAPDLEFARLVADHIQSDHHEVVVMPDEILATLPEAIYSLESFDALLVRSSVMNYLVAKRASDFVSAVFSGEGGDELFAGYEYLKGLEASDLAGELIDIVNRLHNTALQRVDRCAHAFGTVALVGFLDPDVVDYALQIPPDCKICAGVEKWILRQAVADILPDAILNRTKAKFWEGAGVEDLLAKYAEEKVSNADFERGRDLPNGWRINTKEEMLYYRIFREHFGEFEDLSWMGRTKGAPVE